MVGGMETRDGFGNVFSRSWSRLWDWSSSIRRQFNILWWSARVVVRVTDIHGLPRSLAARGERSTIDRTQIMSRRGRRWCRTWWRSARRWCTIMGRRRGGIAWMMDVDRTSRSIIASGLGLWNACTRRRRQRRRVARGADINWSPRSVIPCRLGRGNACPRRRRERRRVAGVIEVNGVPRPMIARGLGLRNARPRRQDGCRDVGDRGNRWWSLSRLVPNHRIGKKPSGWSSVGNHNERLPCARRRSYSAG